MLAVHHENRVGFVRVVGGRDSVLYEIEKVLLVDR